jgi:biotin operon repressor
MKKEVLSMQLDKLVAFYKTMGDPTRVRIVSLLAKGPLHGQAIAGKLGLTPPTITHHLKKLRDISVVTEKRDKNTIYFYLNQKMIKQQAKALTLLLEERGDEMENMVEASLEKQKILANFISKDGRLKSIPAQRKKRLYVFEHIVSGLKKGKKYQEKEINEYIKQFHEDYATIRREFIMNHYMYRENGIYELNPEEMWAKNEN